MLANDTWQAVGYLLAMVQVIPSKNEDAVVGHLGPDLLGPDWDSAEAVRRLRQQPERPIGEALLDQRNLAGIGNIYSAEMLFLRGVNPWRPVGQVADLRALVELAQRLLDANKERSAIITTGVTRRGEENWVYGARPAVPPLRHPDRQGRPGRRRRGPRDVTFWCPRCQPEASG